MIRSLTAEEAAINLENLLGNLPGMAYRCNFDQDYTMSYLSQVCFELTGYQAEELLDNNLLSFNDLIFPEDRSAVWQKIIEQVQNKERFEVTYRIRTRDGQTKWVWERGNAVYDEATNQPKWLEGFIIDMSKEKKAEQEVFDREARLAEILKAVDIGIIFSESSGKIIEVNRAFSEITGIPAQELIGRTAVAVANKFLNARQFEDLKPILMSTFTGAVTPPYEIKFNGRLLRIESQVSQAGKVISFFTDITRQKEYEDNLLNAKLKAEESDRLK